MKNIILLAFSLFIIKGKAAETEKNIKSKPDKIIVFTQGAQVYRTSTVNLTAGQNLLVFSGLENCINASAIQASGNGNFIITDIQYEVHYPELDKAKLNGDFKYKKLIKSINDSISELNYLIEELTVKNEALAIEKNVLLNYGLFKGQSKKDSIPLLKDGLTYLREKLFNINSELLKIKKEKEKINTKLLSLEERKNTINNELLNANGNTEEEKTDYRVLVHVISDQATIASVNINYFISNAGWTPSYDLRALSSEQNVKLTYKAQIHQQSGNDWNNVKLVLSTANPNRSYEIPQLTPWYLGYAKPYYKNKKENYPATAATYDNESNKSAGYVNNENKDEVAEYAYNYTSTNENLIETEYEIKLNYNIPSDGKEHYAAILVKDLKTTYRYKAIPKLNSNVYLTAVLPDWEDAITMGGEASIYYDGSYIGKTYLNNGGTEDTMQLSLGIDKNLAVKRTKIKDKCYEKLLDDDKVHQYSYEILIKNSRNSKIEIDIEDQIPLSSNKNIIIDKKEISGGHFDEITGIIDWRVSIAAKDNKKIILTYQIKAPKSTPIALN